MADTNEAKALADECKELATAMAETWLHGDASEVGQATERLEDAIDRLAALAQQAGTAPQAQPSAAGAVEALRLFVGSAFPVSKLLDPRGHSWSEAYLDQALAVGREVLAQPAAPAVPEGWKLLKDSTHAERSWDDRGDENGWYTNTCDHCGREFLGHKRRRTCKVCASPQPAHGEQPAAPAQPQEPQPVDGELSHAKTAVAAKPASPNEAVITSESAGGA